MSTKDNLLQDDTNEFIPDIPLASELSTIPAEVMAAIEKRIQQFHERYPNGVPMAKRKAPWRMFIEAEDLMLMKRISLRTAQRWLQNTRILLKKKPNSAITVTEFCEANELNEKHIREFLDKLDEEEAKSK